LETVNPQPAPAQEGKKDRKEDGGKADRKRIARIDAVDWLRGLAVVLMIETHLYGYWTSPAAQATALFRDTRWLGGFPFRMFLFMAGVSMAIKFEAQIARGVERRVMVRGAVKRGFEILVLAYLFRLQEYLLSWFWDWRDLLRVDILNCIAASMMVAAPLVAPRGGRPQYAITLALVAALVAVGPIIGPGGHVPAWVPAHLAAYVVGHDRMAAFPLIPPMAWTLAGIAIGHWLVRQNRDARSLTRAFLVCGAVGLAMVGGVKLVRSIDPTIIRYPSEVAQQMGPGTFFYRLGWIGVMALVGHGVTRLWPPPRFSVMRVFGQTSLLVYWVHVELVYGLLFKHFANRLSMAQATVAFVLMTAAMLALSLWRLKYWRGWRPALEAIARALGGKGKTSGKTTGKTANLPSSLGPL
jgi:uncharacterized membrane protein